MHPNRSRHPGACARRRAVALAVAGWVAAWLAPETAAQVSVTDPTSLFTPVTTASGQLMTDPIREQQTGQAQADFLSLAAGTTGIYVNGASTPSTLGSDVAGFVIQSGTLANDPANVYMVFRFRLRDVNGSASSPKTYAGVYVMVGVDLTRDGSVDLIFGADSTGNKPKLVFLKPGTDTNTSPSTTSTSSYTTSASTTLTQGTSSSTPITFAYTASGTNYDSVAGSGVQNMDLTFAISYTNLQQAIRDMGTVNGVNFSNFSVNATTPMNFLAYTSTQPNSFNQDIYGGNLTDKSQQLWTVSDTFDANAKPQPTPEPAAIAQAGLLVMTGLALTRWRRRRVADSKSEI